MAKGATEGAVAGDSTEKAVAEKSPEKTGPAVASVVEELPRAIVRRVVKDKLTQLAASSSSFGKKKSSKEGEGEDVSVQKDALLAFGESARIFIHYLSATANDICKESKRQTINADDVLKAIEEIEFPEFIEPLKASFDEFRRKNASKKSVAKTKTNGSEKKRKKSEEEGPMQNGEDVEDAQAEDEVGGGENPDDNE